MESCNILSFVTGLFPLAVMFSGFIHSVARASVLFILLLNNIPLYEYTIFVYPFIS